MKPENNITTKNIKDFGPEDTFHGSKTERDFSSQYFCKFVKFESGKVTGIVLSVSPNENLFKSQCEAGDWLMTFPLTKCCLKENYRCYFFDSSGVAKEESEPEQVNVKQPENHPSYAVASFNRRYGSFNLFQSSMDHSGAISLTISGATITRDLSHDHVFGKAIPKIEILMTPNQFTELITTFGRGEGTPVTLSVFNGERIEEPPKVNKREIIDSEFNQTVADFKHQILQSTIKANRILESGVSKKKKEEIEKIIHDLGRILESSLPFINSCFKEHSEASVAEAKAAVSFYIESALQKAGAASFEREMKTLIQGE